MIARKVTVLTTTARNTAVDRVKTVATVKTAHPVKIAARARTAHHVKSVNPNSRQLKTLRHRDLKTLNW